MTLSELDGYFRDIFEIDAMARVDSSTNGIQVSRREPQVKRVAFAVDACLETIMRASEMGADVLVVHHGFFWGRVEPITDVLYERIRHLMEADLALYAIHLPLDRHEELGNNAGMAAALGLGNVKPFGQYKGFEIGCRGTLAEPASTQDIVRRLFGDTNSVIEMLPFGPDKNEHIALISGGAPYEVRQALDVGADLYITGDASHNIYHHCVEAGINVIFGGHYQTETWGVRLLSERLARDSALETFFIDVPTGL